MLDSVRFFLMKQVTSSPRSFLAFVFLLLGSSLLFPSSAAFPQASGGRENLHGVLSRVALTPPLRSGSFYLRFSQDGRYLLARDSGGVFVFSAEPLKFLVYIEAAKLYQASFTPDSQAIRMVGQDLRVATRNIENLQQLDVKTLPVKEDCLSVAVPSNGTRLACTGSDFSLRVFDLATAEEIYTSPPDKGLGEQATAVVPLDTNGVYAGPVGFVLANSWAPLANRGLHVFPVHFSPNAQELLVGSPRGGGFRIDLETRKKLSLPGAIKDRLDSSLTWLDRDRVAALEREKTHTPKIFSLESGATLSTLRFTANWFETSSNARYLLLHDIGTSGGRVFDLEENRLLDIPENIGVDVSGSVMALLIEDGELYLYHLGDKLPYRMAHLPPGQLPELRVASLDSSLKFINLAIDGRGAVFSTTVGTRIADFPRFLAAFGQDASTTLLTMPSSLEAPPKILRLDTTLRTSSASAVPSPGNEILRSGGPVLVEYSFENSMGRGVNFADLPARVLGIAGVVNREGGVPFKLLALDPASGAVVWKRSFFQETPVPFPDPQGTRLVLGWRAQSDEARQAASHFPAAKQILKKAKLDEHDTFFEVLDARSGKSLGGVLVQVGNHAWSFDAAFSEGDTLFLLKDGIRVSLVSLSDGALKAKLVGNKPAANGVSGLLALDEGAGRLAVYDARSGAKLDQLLFPDQIAYSHFSDDGKRLFVLTEHQTAFVVDVSGVRHVPSAPPSN
jgi:WD40 repeat protein